MGDLEKASQKYPDAPKPAQLFGVRYLQFLMLFLAAVLGYGMRTNISVGIIAMMEDNPPNPDIPTYPEWTLKNTILSSFFWGYVIPQIGAGQLVKNFGPKWFLGGTFFINSIFCLLTPVMANSLGEAGVIVCRVIQGLNQGFLFPSIHNLLGKWSHLTERSKIASFVYAGGPLGNVISMPVTGLIANSDIGWPAAFYLYGALGVTWVALWAWLGSNSPDQHPTISKEEMNYIMSGGCGEEERRQMVTPWKSIFTSLPFWAILVSHSGQNWGFWTLQTEIPSYMSNIMKYDVEDNSLLSALPYLVLWILSFVFSPLADYCIVGNHLSIANTRKVFNTIGLVGPAIALICLGFVDSKNNNLALSLLVVAVGLNAAQYSGFNVNHIDLSPNHAGILMGITNSFSNVVSIIAPLAVQALGDDETDPLLWRSVFLIAAAVYIASNVFFVIFAKGELQPWNELEQTMEESNEKSENA